MKTCKLLLFLYFEEPKLSDFYKILFHEKQILEAVWKVYRWKLCLASSIHVKQYITRNEHKSEKDHIFIFYWGVMIINFKAFLYEMLFKIRKSYQIVCFLMEDTLFNIFIIKYWSHRNLWARGVWLFARGSTLMLP